MKQFLTKPRSIIGSTLWGIIVAILTFIGILIIDFILSIYKTNFGPARQIESIAVGGGYSISLDATPAHPMLAEYEQSISIYGGGPREGELLGNVEIPMNTGGRVRIGILIPNELKAPEVVLVDRYSTTSINLLTKQSTNVESWRKGNLKPIGIISGESYPIKFIPCSVFPFLSEDEQSHILGTDNEMNGFCDSN